MSSLYCQECGYVKEFLTLAGTDGTIGDSVGDIPPTRCPNDGILLKPIIEEPSR